MLINIVTSCMGNVGTTETGKNYYEKKEGGLPCWFSG